MSDQPTDTSLVAELQVYKGDKSHTASLMARAAVALAEKDAEIERLKEDGRIACAFEAHLRDLARAEAAEAEVERLETNADEWCGRWAQAAGEAQRLREALEKYGQHSRSHKYPDGTVRPCAVYTPVGGDCTCGLTAAKAESHPPTG